MDIYKEITERIITEMEKGIIPWEKPWIASGNCVAHTTGKPYSLLNQMLLGRPGEYITFNQCQKEGGKGFAKSHFRIPQELGDSYMAFSIRRLVICDGAIDSLLLLRAHSEGLCAIFLIQNVIANCDSSLWQSGTASESWRGKARQEPAFLYYPSHEQ